jgi:hypothetical protein
MRKNLLTAMTLAICTMVGSAASHADFVGSVWVNVPDAAGNATIAQAGTLGAPDATFRTAGIAFATGDSTSTTVGDFLASGGAICTGAGCASILNDAYFLITPAVDFLATAPGGVAAITHDDGVQLAGSIDGLIIDSPDPTAPTTDTGPFTGPQFIQLSYGECCGGPAVLIANLGQVMPEPASLAVLGAALVGFGVMRRRRKS